MQTLQVVKQAGPEISMSSDASRLLNLCGGVLLFIDSQQHPLLRTKR